MSRKSVQKHRDPLSTWLPRLVLCAALAYGVAYGMVHDFVHWAHADARDAAMIGQTLAVALLPLLLLTGFGWQDRWRGPLLLVALAVVTTLAGWLI